jgi:hypothetical protein
MSVVSFLVIFAGHLSPNIVRIVKYKKLLWAERVPKAGGNFDEEASWKTISWKTENEME